MLLVLLCATLAACRLPARDTLVVVERITLPAGNHASLYVDPAGLFWLGRPEALARVDRTGALRGELILEEGAIPEFAGLAEERVFFQAAAQVLAVDTAGAQIHAQRAGFGAGPIGLDVRGRYLLASTGPGGMLGHDPGSLEPLWGWPELGAPATALAFSPEGDRVYVALDASDAGRGPELLVRDFQTGRVLAREPILEPLHALVADDRGVLYGVAGDVVGGGVVALRFSGGAFQSVWRRPLGALALRPPVVLRLSPSGERLAALSHSPEPALRLLATRTGADLGHLQDAGVDAAFGPGDELFLLLPGELRRVE